MRLWKPRRINWNENLLHRLIEFMVEQTVPRHWQLKKCVFATLNPGIQRPPGAAWWFSIGLRLLNHLTCVSSITVRWVLGLFAPTQPNCLGLFHDKPERREPGAGFHMGSITERLLLAVPAGTPGIPLLCSQVYLEWVLRCNHRSWGRPICKPSNLAAPISAETGQSPRRPPDNAERAPQHHAI